MLSLKFLRRLPRHRAVLSILSVIGYYFIFSSAVARKMRFYGCSSISIVREI